jgi:predicted  nucleic acid-binding Zn-ribbon protein
MSATMTLAFIQSSGAAMNGNLQLLLRLQELSLLHQALALAGASVEQAGLDNLEERIERVRRQLPGPILSQYDAASLRYLETMAAVSQKVCHACEGEISVRLVAQLSQPNRSQSGPHCGRLLYQHEHGPDYLGTK